MGTITTWCESKLSGQFRNFNLKGLRALLDVCALMNAVLVHLNRSNSAHSDVMVLPLVLAGKCFNQ